MTSPFEADSDDLPEFTGPLGPPMSHAEAAAAFDDIRNLPALKAELDRLCLENGALRELLWANHGHSGLYGDDGEMQCNLTSYPADFKRDSIARLQYHLSPPPRSVKRAGAAIHGGC